jgi:hypothetical protein
MTLPPELRRVIEALPSLPRHVVRAVVALVEAALESTEVTLTVQVCHLVSCGLRVKTRQNNVQAGGRRQRGKRSVNLVGQSTRTNLRIESSARIRPNIVGDACNGLGCGRLLAERAIAAV